MPVLRLIRERFEREQPLDGPAHRRLPPRHDRDRQPDAHAQGRRRRRRARGLQPAVDQGRRRGGARGRVRDHHLRPPRRGPRHVLRAPQRRRRHASAADHGRRLRPRVAAPHGAAGPARRDPGRHRGDDDRRHPAQGDGRRRRPRLPGRGGQRGPDQAPLRQPLRHRPVDASTASCGPRTSCSPAGTSSSPAMAGSVGHRVADGRAWAPTWRSSRSIRSAPSRRSWTASRS